MDQRTRAWRRRDYLSTAALLGLSGLAGCNQPTGRASSTTSSRGTQGDGDDSRLVVRGSSIGANELEIGTKLPVQVVLENTGTEADAFDLKIRIVDQHRTESVELEPGERAEISVAASPMTVGTGDIILNDTQLGTVEVVPVASEDDRTVGAHYFSWYGRDPHTWRGGEWSLESPYTPLLGNYDARNPAVIEQHIDWCHYAGVQWLNAVWTGPDSPIDKNLRNHILDHPRAEELDWSIFYDTLIINSLYDGSSVDLSNEEAASRLRNHITYLADEYFDRENYKIIEGRPVLSTWLGGAYTGDPASVFTEAFEEAGVDPYFIVGIGGRSIDSVELTEIADAVTTYNPYTPREDIEDVFLEQMESTYRSWCLAAEQTGHDVIPTVIPGFNDSEITHVERDNPVLELSKERYANACAVGDEYAEDMVFVTAFNEWYESTFIEPSEEFGTSFLEITADSLAVEDWAPPEFNGSMVTLNFERVVEASEIAPGTEDDRELSMRVYELSVYNNGEKLREIDVGGAEDGIVFVRGYFAPESEPDGDTARWLGGQPTSTLFLENITAIDRLELTGWTGTEMTVSATIDGEPLDTTRVTQDYDTYTLASSRA